ncbi:hypothetical protein HOY80DRAFT_704847 [Tuber brumale]|nr:hypothetical protein HOY80DRAFT_704847 [Tuber brumale]
MTRLMALPFTSLSLGAGVGIATYITTRYLHPHNKKHPSPISPGAKPPQSLPSLRSWHCHLDRNCAGLISKQDTIQSSGTQLPSPPHRQVISCQKWIQAKPHPWAQNKT